MQWRRKLTSFHQQSTLTKLLLLPAWLLTGFSRLMVLLLPFKLYAKRLGKHHGVAAFIPILDSAQQQKALSIGRAVRMSAVMAPWNANCQAQAIAVRILFNIFSIPYSIHYGLSKNPESKLKAHAWVCAGPVQVTGGYGFDEFTVVAVFANASLPASLPRKGGVNT